MQTTPQLTALAVGLVAIVGASVAVCLGHIDPSTYIAVVASFGGVGVGAGVHAAGTTSGAAVANGTSPATLQAPHLP
jgi:hypothetical protein